MPGLGGICSWMRHMQVMPSCGMQLQTVREVSRQQQVPWKVLPQSQHQTNHIAAPSSTRYHGAFPKQHWGVVPAGAFEAEKHADPLQQPQHSWGMYQQQHHAFQLAIQPDDGTDCGGSNSSNRSSSSNSSSSSRNNWSMSSNLLPWLEDSNVMDSQQTLLCEVLHVAPADAKLLLFSCQAANAMNHQQLLANWTMLQQLLPIDKQQLVHALLQLPELLQQPEQTLHGRLAEAAAVLQLPERRLLSDRSRQAVQLRYQLLLMPQQQLQAKLKQLVKVLAVNRKQVVQLLLAEPQLLVIGQAQLISSVEALEQVCDLQLQRFVSRLLSRPQLLVTPAGQLYRAAAGLQQQLHLSEAGLALALRRAPGALSVPDSDLKELLRELSAGLAVSTDVAADILLQEPELLLRRPGAVAAVLGVLRATYRLDAESLLQVVQFDPHILGASAGQLQATTSKFKQLAGRYKGWAVEYSSRLMSRPVNIARALRIEPLRLQRLLFLSNQRLAATISLKAALTMSARQFVLAYPRYRTWLAQRYSHGGVPRQYRGQSGLDEEEDEDDDETDFEQSAGLSQQ